VAGGGFKHPQGVERDFSWNQFWRPISQTNLYPRQSAL
jgi:hypothetical protein